MAATAAIDAAATALSGSSRDGLNGTKFEKNSSRVQDTPEEARRMLRPKRNGKNTKDEEVTNFIPSISAVTGITPQRYVWRICIALHCTPRFAVAFMYYNLYNGYLQNIPKQHQRLFVTLTKVNFWLNIIENSSLIGVTYISNKENYPIHEKIFIVFMVASLCYMLLNTVIFKWTRDKITEEDEKSLKWKVVMFISILVATAGLLFFFVRHRFFCEPLAFSWFSLCEYVIAYTNMGYHVTAAYDFKNVTFYAVSRLAYTSPPATSINGVLVNNNKKQR